MAETTESSSNRAARDLRHVERLRGAGAIIQWLEQLPILFHVGATMVIFAVIGVADLVTRNDINLSIFYLVPVVWATWFIGRRTGLATAVVSAVAWSAVERATSIVHAPLAIMLWNIVARLTLLILIAVLLAEIRRMSEARRQLAYSDPLTGVANTRVLHADLEREIDRLRRYGRPFTFAYIDLDHFKAVNDSLGHEAGDDLLQQVAIALAGSVRDSDVVARLGGDEFAVLMPETSERSARPAIARITDAVTTSLHEVAPAVEGLGATVGAVVFTHAPWSTDHAVRLADELMYEGKRAGRGILRLAVYDGE